LDERNRAYLNIEEQLNKIKLESSNIEKDLREEYNIKITDLMKTYDKQIKGLTEEIENFEEKYRKNKEKKKQIKAEYNSVKAESDRVNLALYNTIQSYEKRIADMKDSFDKEMNEEKKRVDEFLKFNEDLRDSDLYNVYKDLRKKFEDKLKECIDYKDKSEKISKYCLLFSSFFFFYFRLIMEFNSVFTLCSFSAIFFLLYCSRFN